MCRKIVEAAAERAIGYYMKGNEPEPMVMQIIVAPCECRGEDQIFYARTPTGTVWVVAEKEDCRDVDSATAKKLADDIAGIGSEAEGSDGVAGAA